MRLNEIKLQGFKTFAESAVLSISTDLTAVVGPNGCGKSNIMDALRWVLGESSARYLRGENMDDVMFAGTHKRAAAGITRVSLRLDNSDHRLSGPFATYEEVILKRSLNRGESSQYFINNNRVRRRDIVDLLQGSGLVGNAYAMIGQGMISRIIEAKPAELKVYFEEAAEIAPYQLRRREAAGRMAQTRDNLSRVADIYSELFNQHQHVAAQAAKARRYQALQAEHLQKELQFLAYHVEKITQAHEQHQEKLHKLQVLAEEKNSTLRQAQCDAERLAQAIEASEEQSRKLREAVQQAQLRLQKHEQEQSHTQELLRRCEQEMKKLSEAQASKKQEENLEYLQTLRANIAQLSAEQETQEQRLRDAEAVQNTLQLALSTQQSAMRQLEQKEADLRQRETQGALRIRQQEQHVKNLENMLHRQEEQHLALQKQQLNAPDDDLEVWQAKLDHFKQDIEQQEKNYQGALSTQENVRKELAQTQAAALRANSEATALRRVQDSVLQNDSSETGAVLLADCLQIDAAWRESLEAFFASNLRAKMVENEADLRHAAQQGLDAVRRGVTEKTWLQGVLRSNAELGSALKNLCLLEDWADLPIVLPADTLYLHKNGQVLSRDATYKKATELQGVLSRNERLQELAAEAAVLQEKEAELAKRYAEVTAQTAAQAASLKSVRQEHEASERKLRERQNALRLYAEQQAWCNEQLHRLQEECKQTFEQQKKAREQLESMQCEHEALVPLLNETAAQRAAQAARVDEARQHLRQAEANSTAQRRARQEGREALQNLRQKAELLAQEIGFHQKEEESLAQSLQDGHKEKVRLQKLLQNTTLLLTEAQQDVEQARVQLQDGEQKWQNQKQNAQATAQRVEESRQEEEKLRQDIEQQKILIAEARVRLEQWQSRAEELNHWPLPPCPEDLKAAVTQKELKKLQNEMQALMPINMAALEEVDTLAQRLADLAAQQDDLQASLATLEHAVVEMDGECRRRFQKLFDEVQCAFQVMFKRLFRGGKAELLWLGEEEGVDIHAQAPGKKVGNLSLLSGGEKALTAIALIFAIFQSRPAPFCVLDEVDAPLDEANVEALAQLLQEFSRETQFIIITHNKHMMARMQHLIGVTMSEPGVSRLVSVDLRQEFESEIEH